jgi:hypothetical protein
MQIYAVILAITVGLTAFVMAAAPATVARIRRLGIRAADAMGRYTRLACPHCTLTFRFRGVESAEEEWFRQRMADHIADH